MGMRGSLPRDVEDGLLANLHLGDTLLPSYRYRLCVSDRSLGSPPNWCSEATGKFPRCAPGSLSKHTLNNLANANLGDEVAAADGAVEPLQPQLAPRPSLRLRGAGIRHDGREDAGLSEKLQA